MLKTWATEHGFTEGQVGDKTVYNREIPPIRFWLVKVDDAQHPERCRLGVESPLVIAHRDLMTPGELDLAYGALQHRVQDAISSARATAKTLEQKAKDEAKRLVDEADRYRLRAKDTEISLGQL